MLNSSDIWLGILIPITLVVWHIAEKPNLIRRRVRFGTVVGIQEATVPRVKHVGVRLRKGLGIQRLHDLLSAQVLIILFCLWAFISGDYIDSLLMTITTLLLVSVPSIVKFHYMRFRLTPTDLVSIFDSSFHFLIKTYGRLILKYTGLLMSGIIGAFYLAGIAPPAPASAEFLAALLAISVLIFAVIYAFFRSTVFPTGIYGNDRFHFFGFFALMVPGLGPNSTFSIEQVAEECPPLPSILPSKNCRSPHIIVVQHESTFPPSLYGLQMEDGVAEFFTPKDGLSGALKVDIFGGGTWQSEFSFQTGLSSRLFGRHTPYLFQSGTGRFHGSITQALAALGYRTNLFMTVESSFYNYKTFYSSIGMQSVHSGNDLDPAPTVDQSDHDFYLGVLNKLRNSFSDGPIFCKLLTNYNHGPHHIRQTRTAESARDFAFENTGNHEYAEYYARLTDSVHALENLKHALASEFSDQQFLLVRYGDHQPEFVARSTFATQYPSSLQYQTFYVIEGVNFDLPELAIPDPLDIAFLGTLTLQAACIPLDPIRTLHAALIPSCGHAYYETISNEKRGYHRLLLNEGLVRAASA